MAISQPEPEIKLGCAETQEGGMHRTDRITGEQSLHTTPAGCWYEPYERFNRMPHCGRSHDPARLYFASQRSVRTTAATAGHRYRPDENENRMELERSWVKTELGCPGMC